MKIGDYIKFKDGNVGCIKGRYVNIYAKALYKYEIEFNNGLIHFYDENQLSSTGKANMLDILKYDFNKLFNTL